MNTATDFKVSTETGHLLNALRHVEAARSYLYKYHNELLGEETANALAGEYNPIFDNARDYVERLLAEGLTTWANTIDPNTPI